MTKRQKIRNASIAVTALCLGHSLAGQGYIEIFTEAAANAGLGGDALANPFYDSSVADGAMVYSLLRDSGNNQSAIVAYNTLTNTHSVVATPAQIGAATGGNDVGVTYGFTLINGGATLRYLDFFGNALYDTDIATGTTTLVSAPASGSYTANTILRSDGSGYAYESGADSIMAIAADGTFTELLNSAQLTLITGNDLVNGSLGLWNDLLYIGSSSTDNLFFYNVSTNAFGTVFTGNLIDATTDDVDGALSFGDIFTAPDGRVYFYEGDSDAIMSFDPANPDGTLQVVFDEAALLAGPGTDLIGEMTWLNGQLAWADGGDGFYAVPEPSTYAAILGLLALGAIVVRRRRSSIQ